MDREYENPISEKLISALCARKSIKMDGEAKKIFSEFLFIFVTESIRRASQAATCEGETVVTPEAIKRIIPQLLLDF